MAFSFKDGCVRLRLVLFRFFGIVTGTRMSKMGVLMCVVIGRAVARDLVWYKLNVIEKSRKTLSSFKRK